MYYVFISFYSLIVSKKYMIAPNAPNAPRNP